MNLLKPLLPALCKQIGGNERWSCYIQRAKVFKPKGSFHFSLFNGLWNFVLELVPGKRDAIS